MAAFKISARHATKQVQHVQTLPAFKGKKVQDEHIQHFLKTGKNPEGVSFTQEQRNALLTSRRLVHEQTQEDLTLGEKRLQSAVGDGEHHLEVTDGAVKVTDPNLLERLKTLDGEGQAHTNTGKLEFIEGKGNDAGHALVYLDKLHELAGAGKGHNKEIDLILKRQNSINRGNNSDKLLDKLSGKWASFGKWGRGLAYGFGGTLGTFLGLSGLGRLFGGGGPSREEQEAMVQQAIAQQQAMAQQQGGAPGQGQAMPQPL